MGALAALRRTEHRAWPRSRLPSEVARMVRPPPQSRYDAAPQRRGGATRDAFARRFIEGDEGRDRTRETGWRRERVTKSSPFRTTISKQRRTRWRVRLGRGPHGCALGKNAQIGLS